MRTALALALISILGLGAFAACSVVSSDEPLPCDSPDACAIYNAQQDAGHEAQAADAADAAADVSQDAIDESSDAALDAMDEEAVDAPDDAPAD